VGAIWRDIWLRSARPEYQRSLVLSACPLCAHPATITDWRPGAEWIAVEDCPCAGFFVWAPLLAERVRRLTGRQRQHHAHSIRAFRAIGHEAWLTTFDGTVTGPLVIRTERPDRPTLEWPSPKASAPGASAGYEHAEYAERCGTRPCQWDTVTVPRAVVRSPTVEPIDPSPPSDRPIPSDTPAILPLVIFTLAELHTEGQVLDCWLAEDDRYAIRLQTPGEIQRAVIVPWVVLERGLRNPIARQRVRDLLHAAIQILRSQHAISGGAGLVVSEPSQSRMAPRCAHCGELLLADDPIVVENDARWHVPCTRGGATESAPIVHDEPAQFLLTGNVTAWNALDRTMQIGQQLLRVAPEVSVSGIVLGVRVTAIGLQTVEGDHVVTRLTVG
jgi:hypothetical protein